MSVQMLFACMPLKMDKGQIITSSNNAELFLYLSYSEIYV